VGVVAKAAAAAMEAMGSGDLNEQARAPRRRRPPAAPRAAGTCGKRASSMNAAVDELVAPGLIILPL
jgi:hypothetical protein